MKHTSSSTHVHILMSGHNPEHNHKSHGGGISNGQGTMKPENHLMRSHHYSGGITNTPSHFYSGGITNTPPQFSKGGKAHKHKRFAKGGHCYAEGGEADKEYGEKPLTGQLRRGGRAKHYAGGPSTPPHYSEGGRTKHRKRHFAGEGVEGITPKQEMPRQEQKKGGCTKRQHHYWGQDVFGRIPGIGSLAESASKNAGTFDDNSYGGGAYNKRMAENRQQAKEGLGKAFNAVGGYLSKPRNPMRNQLMYQSAPPVRQAQKNGGRSKRQHHYWGQDVIGRLPLVGGIANSIANTAGTLDSNKYGGSEYVADTPGRKAADIASHIGNFAAPLLMLKKGGKAHAKRRSHHAGGERIQEGAPVADNSVRKEHRRGGRTKRSHHYWGQDVFGRLPLVGGLANSIAGTVGTLDPDQYGGANYVADTPGRKAADILSTVGNLGTNLLLSAKGGGKGKGGGAPAPKKKGGGVHHRNYRHHHAAGGAGKVRKGMMTESGHMIHN